MSSEIDRLPAVSHREPAPNLVNKPDDAFTLPPFGLTLNPFTLLERRSELVKVIKELEGHMIGKGVNPDDPNTQGAIRYVIEKLQPLSFEQAKIDAVLVAELCATVLALMTLLSHISK